MQVNADELERLIPYYLPRERVTGFLSELKAFPSPPGPFYIQHADPEPLQGDLWEAVPIVDIESGRRDAIKAIVLTNSCDLAGDNKRLLPIAITYAPLIELNKYRDMLVKGGIDNVKIDNHLIDVRAQRVTSLFYLPSSNRLDREYIALLGNAQSIPQTMFPKSEDGSRLATLSDVAFYLFLFKLSIHFCRMHEEVDRTPPAEPLASKAPAPLQ